MTREFRALSAVEIVTVSHYWAFVHDLELTWPPFHQYTVLPNTYYTSAVDMIYGKSVSSWLVHHIILRECVCSRHKFSPRDAQLPICSQRRRGARGFRYDRRHYHECSEDYPCTYDPHGDVCGKWFRFFHWLHLLLIVHLIVHGDAKHRLGLPRRVQEMMPGVIICILEILRFLYSINLC